MKELFDNIQAKMIEFSHDLNTQHVAKILQWLSSRYCLVEKSTITQMYSANRRLMENFSGTIIYNESQLEVV